MLNGSWPSFQLTGGAAWHCLASTVLTLALWSLSGTLAFAWRGKQGLDPGNWGRAWLGASTVAAAMVVVAGSATVLDWRGGDVGDPLGVLGWLGAAFWLGGLPRLWATLVAGAPPVTYRRFLRLAPWCLAGMAVAGLGRVIVVIGGVPALIGTAYGWAALARLLLIGLLAVTGLTLRRRLIRAGGEAPGIAILLGSQIGLAVLLAFLGAFMMALPLPSETQPIWPFTVRPSLITIEEDPDFRREVITAILACAGALALAAFGIALRRARWPALAMAAIILWRAVPHLDLLVIPAYPTSFYRSPTGFAATTILAGGTLYPDHCASCHGADGRGDGPAAHGLPVPPADLTALHLWAHSDGELFWWLSHGIEAPESGMAMPGFAGQLDEPRRWALIDYIRAHNGGSEMAASGIWRIPVHAPDFSLACADGPAATLRRLRGHVVRLVFGRQAAAAPLAIPEGAPARPVTVRVTLPEDAAPSPAAALRDECHAADPAIVAAYAIVSGLPAADLAGSQFLIDPDGWLRDLERPGYAATGSAPGRWQDPKVLLADIREICNHPIVQKEISHAATQ